MTTATLPEHRTYHVIDLADLGVVVKSGHLIAALFRTPIICRHSPSLALSSSPVPRFRRGLGGLVRA